METLQYKTFADLKAAFDAGTKFEVDFQGGRQAVTEIFVYGTGHAAVVRTAAGGRYTRFRPDGTNERGTRRLIVAPEAPRAAEKPVVKLYRDPASVPFLDRFMAGEQFHTPHTREIVTDVKIKRGSDFIEVTLTDENGKSRTTPRYLRNGRHRFQPERNLVPGRLPPKLVEVKVTIYRHAYNDSLFCVREGEVLPNINGLSNALKVGEAVIREPKK